MKLLLVTLIALSVAACSSSSSKNSENAEDSIPLIKAAPPKNAPSETVHAAPIAIQGAERATPIIEHSPGKGCETPLGPLPDGGTATGWLDAQVEADQVCISDTITCRNGTWSGTAIHPKCTVKKASKK